MGREYPSYGLRRNPFPPHGSFPVGDKDERVFALIMVGREDLKSLLDEKLTSLRKGERASLVLVLGDYGSGKTHCLKYLQYRSVERFGDVLPVYISGISRPSFKKMLQLFLKEVESQLGRDYLPRIAVLAEVEGKTMFPDTAIALKKLRDVDTRNLALRWLYGDPLSSEERSKLGIVVDVDEDMARDILTTIINLIWEVDGKKVLLLIDELENVLSSSVEDLFQFYSGLRDFIDRISAGMVVIAATNPIYGDDLKGIPQICPALENRIQEDNLVKLSPMRDVDIVSLLKAYLRAFRTSKARQMTDEAHPFSEEALRLIADFSKGVPRVGIQTASKVIREAADRDKNSINAPFVREVLGIREVEERGVEVLTTSSHRLVDVVEASEPSDRREDLKRRIIYLLEKSGGSAVRSSLKDSLRIGYNELDDLLRELESEGRVRVVRRGRGGRAFLLKSDQG